RDRRGLRQLHGEGCRRSQASRRRDRNDRARPGVERACSKETWAGGRTRRIQPRGGDSSGAGPDTSASGSQTGGLFIALRHVAATTTGLAFILATGIGLVACRARATDKMGSRAAPPADAGRYAAVLSVLGLVTVSRLHWGSREFFANRVHLLAPLGNVSIEIAPMVREDS